MIENINRIEIELYNELFIKENYVFIQKWSPTKSPKLYEYPYKANNVLNALGDIIDEYIRIYPSNDYFSIDYIKNSIFERREDNKYLCGFPISPTSLNNIFSILGEKDIQTFTLDDIEDLRLNGQFNITPKHLSNVTEKGYSFIVNNIDDVLMALLYFYAKNNLKLVKCVHCGRWFATSSLKNEYCDRRSPIEKYSHLSCYEAVQNMRQQCRRIRNRIYNNAINTVKGQRGENNSFIRDFNNECSKYCYKNKPTKILPSKDALTAYYTYLKQKYKEKGWL